MIKDMKSVVRIMSIALASLFVLVSCDKDKVDYNKPENELTENIGYLSLGNMQASVLEDTENIDSATRAEGVDINNFDVVITNKAGEAVASFKYGERPTEPIALEGGVYLISMSSSEVSIGISSMPTSSMLRDISWRCRSSSSASHLGHVPLQSPWCLHSAGVYFRPYLSATSLRMRLSISHFSFPVLIS